MLIAGLQDHRSPRDGSGADLLELGQNHLVSTNVRHVFGIRGTKHRSPRWEQSGRYPRHHVEMDPAHLTLDMPEGIDIETRSGLQAQVDRLKRAVHNQDRSLAVGTTKELVEAVARAVLHARGQQVASGDEFDKVLSNAHELLQYQTGAGLAPDASVRAIASGAKKIAGRLRELRNDFGTGHGRHLIPVIEDEALDLCIEASLLWTRWALRRLQHLIAGSPTALVRDLWSTTFSAGKLAARLQAANLPALGTDDQRALGVAVGQRASRGTFMVRIEGVEACAQDQNDAAWPSAYREPFSSLSRAC